MTVSAPLPYKLFAFLLSVASCSALCEVKGSNEDSTCLDENSQSPGSQLMQKKQIRAKLDAQVVCSTGIGRDAPLTEEGFRTVEESCCYDDMKDFIRRTAQ